MWERTRLGLLVAVCLTLVATVAFAGNANGLRTTLSRMHAAQPVKATVSVSTKVSDGDKNKPKVPQAKAQWSLIAGSGEFRLTYGVKLLQDTEAKIHGQANDPDALEALKRVWAQSPMKVYTLVDFAPMLLHQLDGATLQSRRMDTYNGKPVRLLVFKVPAQMPSGTLKKVDHYKGRMKVWLGADGVPVAVSISRVYKASKWLFFHMRLTKSMRANIRQMGQRLVAVRFQQKTSVSAPGHHKSKTTRVNLDVAPLVTRSLLAPNTK